MLIGVPKEIKVHEYRVGLTPESVRRLTERGHGVIVEQDAGAGIGARDADYRAAGAAIAASAAQVFAEAELIVKIKEPLAPELERLRPGQALFTYLHLLTSAERTRALAASGAIGIAYETVTSPQGKLPLLAPMSEIAGRMAIQVAAHYLERSQGGRGVLLAGAGGAPPARVLVLGAGVVGSSAAETAIGVGAEVTVLGRSAESLARLSAALGPRVKMLPADPAAVAEQVRDADAVIGAAMVPGAPTPKLVTRAMLGAMKPGAVLVDVAIDQGGCFETSRPTTHADPVYLVDGILHYCVPNMPGAVPRTATYAINRATVPFVLELADRGIAPALRSNPHLRAGLHVYRGKVANREIAQAHGYAYAADALEA